MMKTREDKRMVKLGIFFNIFKISLFGHIFFIKNQHIHFLVHGHSSWSSFGLHLMRGPKALYIEILRNWTKDKRPSSMAQLHGPQCKPTLTIGPTSSGQVDPKQPLTNHGQVSHVQASLQPWQVPETHHANAGQPQIQSEGFITQVTSNTIRQHLRLQQCEKWWANIQFLNLIPKNFTAQIGQKVQCYRGMRLNKISGVLATIQE